MKLTPDDSQLLGLVLIIAAWVPVLIVGALVAWVAS